MVATWVVIGLLFSAFSVSTLGAAFSIFGLRELFSGAALAVVLMAASLEFAKFTLAAYLHQRWLAMNKIFKTYLVSAVAILSVITSMGIYGFLSNAYQSASSVLQAEQFKHSALEGQLERHKAEIARLNKAVDELPTSRVTKRLELRKEIEPQIAELNKQVAQVATQLDQSNLKVLEVAQKVGPLIYISKAFNVDIDNVVKYLILILVLVFDPLAISLVIASSEALTTRSRKETGSAQFQFQPVAQPAMQPTQPQAPIYEQPPAMPAAQTAVTVHPPEHIVNMRFAAEEEEVNKDEKAV